MRLRLTYTFIGFVLGLGAPLGALLMRGVIAEHAWWESWIAREWQTAGVFYLYMAVTTTTAFALFGRWLDLRLERLRQTNALVEGTFDTLNLLAVSDGLTGLYNHRFLQERLALEIEGTGRGRQLSVLLLDIDNFKRVNDTYGHPFGDLVLLTVARMIRENIRRVDTAGRYGGEEFLVIMPHTTPETAAGIAERIRQAVENYVFALKDTEVRATVSAGVATYPSRHGHIRDKASLLYAADRALYEAKAAGKNRIMSVSSARGESAI